MGGTNRLIGQSKGLITGLENTAFGGGGSSPGGYYRQSQDEKKKKKGSGQEGVPLAPYGIPPNQIENIFIQEDT